MRSASEASSDDAYRRYARDRAAKRPRDLFRRHLQRAQRRRGRGRHGRFADLRRRPAPARRMALCRAAAAGGARRRLAARPPRRDLAGAPGNPRYDPRRGHRGSRGHARPRRCRRTQAAAQGGDLEPCRRGVADLHRDHRRAGAGHPRDAAHPDLGRAKTRQGGRWSNPCHARHQTSRRGLRLRHRRKRRGGTCRARQACRQAPGGSGAAVSVAGGRGAASGFQCLRAARRPHLRRSRD